MDLDDLAAASAIIPDLEQHHQISPIVQANAVIYAIPKSLRERVISLHERMGHANRKNKVLPSLAGGLTGTISPEIQ